MGAKPWDYFVPYETNIGTALGRLRPREFQNDYSEIASLPDTELIRCFGTTQPTRKMIEDNLANAAEEDDDLYQNISRGQGFYIVTYKNNKASEIFFGGYTYD